ncbi:MAG: histidinol dehydrogenase, partial [Acidobacteria bacterium]|nr:histidinol dehydrogenase [Acidobacteriota bacterium]
MAEVGGSVFRVLAAGSFAGRDRLELLDRRGRGGPAVEIRQTAAEIVDRVRAGGDAALLEAVRRFDGHDAPSAAALRLAGDRPRPAGDEVEPAVLDAIERARGAIEAYHRALLRGPGVERVDRNGVRIEERRIAIRRVGLYVPGGRFPYPSTVLMTAVPARLAGVEEIAVATPPRAYLDSPVLRHVLDLAGVDEVWGMGGAH